MDKSSKQNYKKTFKIFNFSAPAYLTQDIKRVLLNRISDTPTELRNTRDVHIVHFFSRI